MESSKGVSSTAVALKPQARFEGLPFVSCKSLPNNCKLEVMHLLHPNISLELQSTVAPLPS